MNRRPRWAVPVLCSAAVLAALGVTAVNSQASADDSTVAVTVDAPLYDPDDPGGPADLAKLQRTFWTPERIASAVPLDQPVESSTDLPSAPAGEPGGPQGSVPPVAAAAELPTVPALPDGKGESTGSAAVSGSATVGKVYLWDGPRRRANSCSASTVNSGSRRLVVTAGHCVNNGGKTGHWYQNWVFIPAYDHGSAPYGTFWAKSMTSFRSWVRDGNFGRDVAFVALYNSDRGRRVVDAVGGNGLTWNAGYEPPITILGYPAEDPFDGMSQHYCRRATSRIIYWPALPDRVQMRCSMTGGSSGGPWLYKYDSARGLGHVNGVMSGRVGTSVLAAYFDTAVGDMFRGVADRV